MKRVRYAWGNFPYTPRRLFARWRWLYAVMKRSYA
jgi:hypothetical protein